jgi:NodT family efflux transporter outer membrane factor (OMF) lipoprotein
LLVKSTALAAVLTTAGLAGCAVGPDYQKPGVRTPAAFVAEATTGSSHASRRTEVDLRQWWRSLRDKELDSLVDRALTSNFNLAIALARIQAAREQIVVVAGAALPQATISAGGGSGTSSDETRGRASPAFRSAENAKNLNAIDEAGGFAAGWDLDLFGKVKRRVEAATDEAEALNDARDWIYVTVAADVARAYLDMRAQERELVVLGQNINAARTSLNLAQSRLDRGLTNELDVSLAKRELGTLEAGQGPLRAQIEASQHAIAVLLGEYPETLTKELARGGPIPVLPRHVPVGIPADLLRRRPDIQQAERQLAAANADIGAAIANLFPDVVLVGSAGLQGGPRSSSTLLPYTGIWSIGPALNAPFLDFGALDAQVKVADFRTQALLVGYREAIVRAVQQVDDADAAFHAQQERLADLDRALTAAHEATRIATERYDRGLTDFLNVLDAERQEYGLEESRVAARQVEAEALVGLFRALGGGWPLKQNLPEIPKPEPAVAAAVKYLMNPEQGPLNPAGNPSGSRP